MGVTGMKDLHQFLRQQEDIKSILDGVTNGIQEQLISGLTGSARALFITALDQSKQKKLIITNQLIQAQQLYDDLIELSNNNEVYLYPVNELIAVEMAVASPESRMMRIKALLNWLRSEDGIIIAPIAELKRMLPPKDYWYRYQLKITVGEEIDVNHYLETLVHMGYEG